MGGRMGDGVALRREKEETPGDARLTEQMGRHVCGRLRHGFLLRKGALQFDRRLTTRRSSQRASRTPRP